MKMLIGLLAFAMSFATVASTGETKSFVFDGSQNSVELLLRAEKTHTEYRYDQVHTTCYRTEIVGYRRICQGGGYPRPYPGPGPVGHCYMQPVYRTIPYSCIETVRVPFEVKDYDVDARVMLDISKVSSLVSTETFKVSLMGDKLGITASGSKLFFLVLKKQKVDERMSGSVKFLDASYSVEMVEAASALKALTMTSISVKNSLLKFNIGPTSEDIAYSLKIKRKKTLASDPVLFDRELNASEINLSATSSGTAAQVDVKNLGVQLSGGKFELTAKAFLKVGGPVLNEAQFNNKLSVSKTLIYTNR